MTEKEEIIKLKKELEDLQTIIKQSREAASTHAETADQNIKEKAIRIVELRHMKDKDKKKIEEQELIEDYTYEKGQQNAYMYMYHSLGRLIF